MRHIIQKQMFHATLQGGGGNAVSSLIGAVLVAEQMYCAPSWHYGVLIADIPEKKNARSRNCGPFKTKNKKHEAKIINYLEFEAICITNRHILIEWTTPQMDENESLQISRTDFEQWLYQTCRLDWCLTELISGEHQTKPTYEWIYAPHGISTTELKTYIVARRLIC